jgi:hypothetical protein
MSHFDDIASCEHRDEMLSVLYGEATKFETEQFEQHMQECVACSAEMLGFKRVRESVGAWKFEALAGAAHPQVNVPLTVRRKSAVAALREFVDLSPLWLKGATAFATLMFFALALLAFGQLKKNEAPVISKTETQKVYTEREKDQLVKQALDDQRAALQSHEAQKPVIVHEIIQRTRPARNFGRSSEVAKAQRPLTKFEREQLAADLRLLGGDDEDGLQLLSDPLEW